MQYFSQYEGSRLVCFGRGENVRQFAQSMKKMNQYLDNVGLNSEHSDLSYVRMDLEKYHELLDLIENISLLDKDKNYKPTVTALDNENKDEEKLCFKVIENEQVIALGADKTIEEYKEKYFKDKEVLICEISTQEFYETLMRINIIYFSKEVDALYDQKFHIKYYKLIEEDIFQGWGSCFIDEIKIDDPYKYHNSFAVEITQEQFLTLAAECDCSNLALEDDGHLSVIY